MAAPNETGAIRLEGREALAPSAVHWLPCSLAFNGPAKVAEYFEPRVKQAEAASSGQPIREAFFRGRGLMGAQLDLPDGFRGYLLEDGASQQQTDTGASSWEAVATFEGFTYWNHDARPLETDTQQKVAAWMPLAQQMHTEISPADVEARIACEQP